MILTVLPEGDPYINQSVPQFDFLNPPIDPEELFRDLKETAEHHDAFGLAANQCGLPYRAFVIRNERWEFFICINPVIEERDLITMSAKEGCLSFPDLELEVARPKSVLVTYSVVDGTMISTPLTGLQARGFQHELDHLDGINFKQRVSRLVLDRAKNRRTKKARQKRD